MFRQKKKDAGHQKDRFNCQEQPSRANQQFWGKKRMKYSYSEHTQGDFPERSSLETNLICMWHVGWINYEHIFSFKEICEQASCFLPSANRFTLKMRESQAHQL